MSDSLGLTLLKEGVVTPTELVEAHKLCSRDLRGYERAPVVAALVAALARFRQAQDETSLRWVPKGAPAQHRGFPGWAHTLAPAR